MTGVMSPVKHHWNLTWDISMGWSTPYYHDSFVRHFLWTHCYFTYAIHELSCETCLGDL